MNREVQINNLKITKHWDLIVIGGGASGLGIAIDSASRGYKTVLFEAFDFSKGTSSRSTKLVHGGVRYLQQFNISLVREALKERGYLLKNANHLVKNQSFIIPCYSFFDCILYFVGLTFYDLLAGSLSFGRSRYISKKNVIKYLPTIQTKNLFNGILYHDGQFDDTRLAINMAQTAINNGATVLNYSQVISLLKGNKNEIIGMQVLDKETNEKHDIYGKVVVNATGVFMNDILSMDKNKEEKFIVPSQGIHLVFDKSFLPTNSAIMIPKTSDGRVFFAVPWHNKIIVGTTDTLIEKPSFEPEALEKEIDFVLETSRRFLNPKPEKKDILSIFAGLRPLAAPTNDGKKTKEISRSHKVIVSESGLISITGGKWTTYRKMAEDTIEKIINLKILPNTKCITKNLSIYGNKFTTDIERENYLYVYGSDIPKLQELQREKPEYAEKLHPNYDFTIAYVIWAVRNEMARTIEDVLARRVRLLFLDTRAAIEVSEKVASIIAKELNRDKEWEKNQILEFKKLANNYLLNEYKILK